MPSIKKFAHRPVRAGLFESICLCCFRTIGNASAEDMLPPAEAKHVCNAEDIITLHGRFEPEKATSPGQDEESA